MELSKEQLLQIDNFIFSCGIKYYDVRTEIVDHFANILEERLAKNPDLDFKKEIRNIHSNFSDRGFSKLLKEKTKSVQKKFYKQSFKHLITFFKLPRILISAGLFYTLFLLMNLFEDKKDFFFLAYPSLLFVAVLIFYQNWKINKEKRETFLVLNKTNSFLQIVNLTSILFNSITNFRSEESFLNPTQNIIQLGVFVLLLLFYWSGEYVFHQNKKMIKEQYPNVIV
ncbi:hypothetical protein KO506_07050 [Polaribacter vadi]|uniref:hypothetical protein n=1 Tax=Polaribacter TaxID=52959 RepID=UPI001C0A5FF4|nr:MULTISPECIES: hypothetical protein [Polaribacter]MBU3011154.1 hypothetical protein [Polaribacter vadi]MDO6740968.1 hypothetical protein [Polaribacter sp. 1_MG-2023]